MTTACPHPSYNMSAGLYTRSSTLGCSQTGLRTSKAQTCHSGCYSFFSPCSSSYYLFSIRHAACLVPLRTVLPMVTAEHGYRTRISACLHLVRSLFYSTIQPCTRPESRSLSLLPCRYTAAPEFLCDVSRSSLPRFLFVNPPRMWIRQACATMCSFCLRPPIYVCATSYFGD